MGQGQVRLRLFELKVLAGPRESVDGYNTEIEVG
jgi:hypothetical protein